MLTHTHGEREREREREREMAMLYYRIDNANNISYAASKEHYKRVSYDATEGTDICGACVSLNITNVL